MESPLYQWLSERDGAVAGILTAIVAGCILYIFS